VPNDLEVIEDTTGELVGAITGTGGGTGTGTGGTSYVMGTGVRCVWNTAGFVGGRHVRGTTFLVPVTQGNFEGDGQVTAGFRTTVLSAAGTLLASGSWEPMVFSRPVAADPDATPPIAGRDGSSHAITSASCPDKVSWLRSRRT
jgi:hypothetical protein